MTATIILSALALLILFWGVGAYKRLLRLQRQFTDAFAQLGVQLKIRQELATDLAKRMKEQAPDEEAINAVLLSCGDAVKAGSTAANAPSDAVALRRLSTTEAALSTSLHDVMALKESHAELNKNPYLTELSGELADVEKSIAFAWQVYNNGAAQYNAASQQFPSSIVAVMFAFRPGFLLPSLGATVERAEKAIR